MQSFDGMLLYSALKMFLLVVVDVCEFASPFTHSLPRGARQGHKPQEMIFFVPNPTEPTPLQPPKPCKIVHGTLEYSYRLRLIDSRLKMLATSCAVSY